MDGRYFYDLYNRATDKGGSEHITYYLQHFNIPDEYNPATLCQRAPSTSSTTEALAVGLGTFEQEVAECIAESLYGYRGGWLSSCQIGDMLQTRWRHKADPPPLSRRRELLANMGYYPHPGLPNGRSTTKMATEGNRKPTFYVSEEHQSLGLVSAAVMAAYLKAQEAQGGI
jgi:hypothetical protein